MPWLILLALLGLASTAHAFTYYVATTGVNPPSRTCEQAKSASTPMQSINEGLKCATGGDTVQVAAGTYAQKVNLNSPPVGGSAAGGYITLQGTGTSTLINAASFSSGRMIYGRHVKYMKIKNFELANFPDGGIYLFGSTDHVEITDNNIHNNSTGTGFGSAIRVTGKYSLATNADQGQEQGTGQYVTIARNTISDIITGPEGTAGTPSFAGTETMTVGWNIEHFLIEDNVIDNGQFIGIDLIGRDPSSPDAGGATLPRPPNMYPRKGIIRRNVVKNMNVGIGAGDVGLYCDGCEDIVYEHNSVDGSPGYCYAFSVEWPSSKTQQIIARHNVGRACSTAIFHIGPSSASGDQFRVVHNTGIKTKEFGPTLRYFHGDNVHVKNNIMLITATASTPYSWHGPTHAAWSPQINYNIYYGDLVNPYWQYKGVEYFTTFAAYQTGSGQDAQGKFQDPMINTTTGILLTGSPAINAGGNLTTVVSTSGGGAATPCNPSSSPTILKVQDARYFTDGYGMVPGDSIRVGTGTGALTAQVIGVNYSTNELTLANAVGAIAVGAPVNYSYVGTAPDIGFCEYVSSGVCQ